MAKYNYSRKGLKGLTPFPFLGEVKTRLKAIEAAPDTMPRSIYNANILAAKLVERGVRVRMYDTSVTPASYILSNAFRCSHLVFAATTYNAGIFVTMENLLHDIANHNLQNRRIAVMENGSWAPTSGKQMRDILSALKGCSFIGDNITLRSSLAEDQLPALDALADAIAAEIKD